MSNPFRVGQRLTDFASVDLTVQRVAAGGMGAVAIGPDQMDNGHIGVLKTMRADVLVQSAHVRDRFITEALVWVGLWTHANLLTAQTVTEIEGQPMLILDYAEQGSVRDLLVARKQKGERHLPLILAIDIAQHIAAGLVALHTPDPAFLRPDPLIHRDLKPDNLLIKNGFIKITDFGLAKVAVEAEEAWADAVGSKSNPTATQSVHTQRGVALGTPAYMAPEQWKDAATVTPAADLYALGQILAELCTGHLAIRPDATYPTWYEAHQYQVSPSLREQEPAIPDELASLVQTLLAKDPTQRPTAVFTMSQLQAIAPLVDGTPYSPPEIVEHTRKNEMVKWHNWSLAYYRFDRYKEALACNERAMALDPTQVAVLTARGSILRSLQSVEEAEATYRQVLSLLPETDRVGRKMVCFNLGRLCVEAQRYAEAEQWYAQAVQLMPDDATAWGNRASNLRLWAVAERAASNLSMARNHVQQGLTCVMESIRLGPNDPIHQRQREDLQEVARVLGM